MRDKSTVVPNLGTDGLVKPSESSVGEDLPTFSK